ncbi:ankyrin repeat domain-containing protein 26-like isoform X2 [Sarcophilus harrisii]|uniref:ankyrin repeat domain-containing protein 26-like isoform X2 n=1 Tax=Sarcophilus harrisii TaxID=9305 RepID=UPI0013020785|nr:ankyrin repeat domain-containing protein 26-like isoform X2 [Sarcophilus harrisii]
MMRKFFSFRGRKGHSRTSAIPRRDCGVPESDTSAGYLLRDKELGKLHKAASIGDVAKVQQLLLGGKHDVNDLDKMKRTPLHLACAKGYPDVVSALVEGKCKLDLCDNENRTPLIKAVQCQQEECTTILLEHGADVNLVEFNNNTALHYAASGQNKAIAAQLLKHKCDIEAKNKNGYTPLLLAITEENHEMVDFFLKNGASVNTPDKSSRTALMIAVSQKPSGIVNLLLRYDVDLSYQDTGGWTAEQYANVSGYPIHRQLVNQYEIQKEHNQHLSSQISCSPRASGFTLGGLALDKEDIKMQKSPVQKSGARTSGKEERSFAEESLSRFSDKPGTGEFWPTKDKEELDFIKKEEIIELEQEDGVLVKKETRKQTPIETPNIPKEHSTSARSIARKDIVLANDAESPWNSECTSASLPEGSASYIFAATNQTIKGSISMGQLKDHSQRKPNWKAIQPTLHMKDSLTNQKVENGVKEKQTFHFMEEFDLDDADDVDGIFLFPFITNDSDWDSTSISLKNKTITDLNFNGNYACKSLALTKNHSGSTEFGKITFKKDEAVEAAAEAGSGPEIGFKVLTLVEKLGPQEQCEQFLEKEDGEKDKNLTGVLTDLTQEMEFKNSVKGHESFVKSDQKQDKVTLETANIPEQTVSKKQVKPISFPVLYLKRKPQGPEPDKGYHVDDMHLDEDPNWEERYEKMWVEEEKMEVKKNFKVITTELKQMFGEIYEKDTIADQPTEKLQEVVLQDVFEEELEQLQEASLTLANDSEEKEKYGGPLNVGVQSFPGQMECGLKNAALQDLKPTFIENVLQASCNLYSENSNLPSNNDNKPETESTYNINEEVVYDAENITDSKKIINEIKEDRAFDMQIEENLNRNVTNLESDSGCLIQSRGLGSPSGVQLTSFDGMKSIQIKKPTLITATKFNEKIKLNETLFQNSDDHKTSNATTELRRWRHSFPFSDKLSKMHLEKELNKDLQRFKSELGMLQVEFLTLEREKAQLQKEDKVQMDTGDLDDFTQSSDTVTEDYDLSPSNYKNVMLLIEHLSVDCKDSVHLLKIQDAVLTYERSVELKKAQCSELERKVKTLEKKITGLQEKLSETRKVKSQFEHQKVEWDRELYRVRFTLKQEKEKQSSIEMLFEKTKEQLRKREEQYNKEVHLKQQLEFKLRTLDRELTSVRNNFKQVEEERNDVQRQLSQEQSARVLQYEILNNHLWKQKEIEAATSKMIQSSEVPDSQEKEKRLLCENQSLQDEVVRLKLELETLKIKTQEKENRYVEENEILKKNNDELRKELKLKEASLRETILQYNGQVNVLTTENAILNSGLEDEKQNRDKLEKEIKSYHARLNSAILDHERSQTSKLDLEHNFQRERDEWLHVQAKLNDNYGVVSQELSKAESKVNRLENELCQLRDSLREKTVIIESVQRELKQAQYKATELKHKNQMDNEKLDRYIVKQESIQERLAQIQSENILLRKQLEDAQNKDVIEEDVLNTVQVQFRDFFNQLHADNEKHVVVVEERNKELINECNHLREQMCKYENEKAEREDIIKQLQQELADSLKKQSMTEASLEATSHFQNNLEDNRKLQKEVNHIKSKLQESQEWQKQSQQFIKELEEHKEKLEIENARLEATVKQQVDKIEHIQKNVLDSTLINQIEELKQHLEATALKCKQLKSINRSLQEELFSMKYLQNKYDNLEKNNRELEELVLYLKHNLEISKLEHSQIEQFKQEIKEEAKQEIIEKLREVNLFLQEQAASQENLEHNNTSIRNQMECRIQELEAEISKMKNSHQTYKAALESYKKSYREELKIKASSNKLDRTNERLAELSSRPQTQKSKTLANSFTVCPVQEMPLIGNLHSPSVLNRSFIPRGDLGYPMGNTVSSPHSIESYLTKMRRELEKNITRELHSDNAGLESGPCWASPIVPTHQPTGTPNVNQDPLSRAKQEYLEVLNKKYML